ncbi:hypothetical protein [Erythrobacter sp. Alg231-14]|uniref:hypothetical protein n=1 Tax=Erythrobacter sp. Alg231-14 TaxID=1922225 RepID=UPI00307B1071
MGPFSGTYIIAQNTLNRSFLGSNFGPAEHSLITQLSGGGDGRITLDGATGLNKYLSAPYPRDVLAYSSSTVSDISSDAFAHLLDIMGHAQSARRNYGEWLAQLRHRLRAAFSIDDGAQIVFAPSGTDLEYVALAAVMGKGANGIHNVLLGADEIGSGCVHSAIGRYFATETALGAMVEPAAPVPGMGPISLVDIPVRCGAGEARASDTVTMHMAQEIEHARRAGKHCLVHGVHGSKTGLVLPGLADIKRMQERFAGDVTFVIDACQARITSEAIARYLSVGAIVLMTGSKFIGAPPFNGWAIVPGQMMQAAQPLPSGFETIFRRAEWPSDWSGAVELPDTENLSLALRLEAAVFELERFQRIDIGQVAAILAAFERALTRSLIAPLGARRIVPGGVAENMPIEMRTLATLDVSGLPGLATFDEAQAVHKELALAGVRLGQPVKCVAAPEGWGGTLRVGLSMPQIITWAQQPIDQTEIDITKDMTVISRAVQDTLATELV